jgi:hypothetical protein
MKTFYICSYGGCGSKMLQESLNKYGRTQHVHSRKPPDKLEYIGDKLGSNNPGELFNGIPIPNNDIKNFYVIYIYRNPSYSIPSRFLNPLHLEHIQTNKNIKIQDVLNTEKDLYGINEFYNNYTEYNENRNYKIYSVKYEEIFDKQDELSEILGIGKLNLVNKSNRKDSNKQLDKIYKDLIDKMNKNNFVVIN